MICNLWFTIWFNPAPTSKYKPSWWRKRPLNLLASTDFGFALRARTKCGTSKNNAKENTCFSANLDSTSSKLGDSSTFYKIGILPLPSPPAKRTQVNTIFTTRYDKLCHDFLSHPSHLSWTRKNYQTCQNHTLTLWVKTQNLRPDDHPRVVSPFERHLFHFSTGF